MIKYLFLSIALLISVSTLAQRKIAGRITDSNGSPLVGAVLRVNDSFQASFADDNGRYELNGLEDGDHTVDVTYIGYKPYSVQLNVYDQDVSHNIILEEQAINGPEIVVSATRASHRDPIAYSEIQKAELLKVDLGMDIPEVLNTLPSITFSSDAGNGIGYTYMRLRGSDQTNINVTINGVPLNDPESHGVFWVNIPDLLASTDNIQVQRGVGTSTTGAGAFGGSVGLLTQSVRPEAFGNVKIEGGSFNTQKYSVGFGTGIMNNRWNMEGRLSRISSDGYMDRSRAELQSYFFTAGYQSSRINVKLLLFGGNEVTQQAWWGVPRARLEHNEDGMLAFAADNGWSASNTQNLLAADRRFNYYTYDNEVDDYGQDHAHLHLSHKLDQRWRLNASLHYTKGKGYFEQFQDASNVYDDTGFDYYGIEEPIINGDTISSADFIRRRWLDNDFYGALASVQYRKGPWQTVIGAGWNKYEGSHFGEVIWASIAGSSDIRDRYYDNDAVKEEMNAYVKTNYRIANDWDVYIDLQGRTIDYLFVGPSADNGSTDQVVDYVFFNPKAGLTYTPSDKHRAFISYGIANKEPNRDDHVISTENSRPRAQRLADLELGYSYRSKRITTEMVLYNMQYEDQLINTGEINDVGENIRSNVKDSHRRGLELQISTKPIPAVLWAVNMTFSQNRILDHVEYVTDYLDYSVEEQQLGDVDIAFSPALIAGSSLRITLRDRSNKGKGPGIDINLLSKYVGDQYLDNTETAARTIDAYMTHDIRLDVDLNPKSLRSLNFNVLIRNVFDEEYTSSGWTYRYLYGGVESSFDALFPQAGINFLTGLSLDF